MTSPPPNPRPSSDEHGTASPPPYAKEDAPTQPPSANDWWFDGDDGQKPPKPGVGPGDSEKHSPVTWVAAGVGAVIIGAASIVGINAISTKLSQSAAATTNAGPAQFGPGAQGSPGGFGQGGPGGVPGGGQGGFPGGIGGLGTIDDVDGSTINISSPTGQSTKVVTNGSTTFSKTITGSVGDIKIGDNVTVIGTTADRGITATRITDTGTVADAGPGAPGGAPGGQPGADGGQPQGQAPGGQGQASGGQGFPGGGQNGQFPGGQAPAGQNGQLPGAQGGQFPAGPGGQSPGDPANGQAPANANSN